MIQELERFIEQIHNEPYNIFTNNCLTKSTKIYEKAKELGFNAELVGCISLNPVKLLPFAYPFPHVLVEIDGIKVDVSFSPEQEEKYFRGDIVSLLPFIVLKHTEHGNEVKGIY